MWNKPCVDGVVVIAISLFPEVPGSIPERGKKRRSLWIRLFVHAVHLLSFLRRSDPLSGDNLALANHLRFGPKPHFQMQIPLVSIYNRKLKQGTFVITPKLEHFSSLISSLQGLSQKMQPSLTTTKINFSMFETSYFQEFFFYFSLCVWNI